MPDPIETPDGRPVRYAERDPIGVEGQGATGPAGVNAEAAWIREQHVVQLHEHDADGVHDTAKIARAFLDRQYVDASATFALSGRSYLLGDYGAAIASVTRIGVGRYIVTLADSLGSELRIADATITWRQGDTHPPEVRVQLRPTPTANSFEVWRYEDGTPTDGPFQLLVHSP